MRSSPRSGQASKQGGRGGGGGWTKVGHCSFFLKKHIPPLGGYAQVVVSEQLLNSVVKLCCKTESWETTCLHQLRAQPAVGRGPRTNHQSMTSRGNNRGPTYALSFPFVFTLRSLDWAFPAHFPLPWSTHHGRRWISQQYLSIACTSSMLACLHKNILLK